MAWHLACPEWEEKIRAGKTPVANLPLIEAEAARAVAIFNLLHLPDVPGTPTLAVAAGDWQRDIVRAVFGSYDQLANERHIREFFVMVPKKSSKTTAGAAIMLVALLMNKRPRAEFLLIAPTLEVADLAFRQAVGMIEADPVLMQKFQVRDHLKIIVYRPTKAFLKVKSFDPKVVTGAKPSGVLMDELHVFASSPEADRVIGQLRGGLVANPEGFLITITTQSERPPAGVFRSELLKARAVRDGRADLPILPILYEFPDGVDWRDPINWHMVMPNNGRSITVERLIPDFHAAEATGEAEIRRWASQHLNVEIGVGLKSDGWVGAEFWEASTEPGLTLEVLLERSEVVVVGIDGGGLDDLLGLCVMGRCKSSRRWLSWHKAWAHEIVLKRHRQVAAIIQDFQESGDLTIVATPGADVIAVADIVTRIDALGLLAEKGIGVDAAGIGDIVDELVARNVAIERIIAIPQGWRLGAAIKTTERKLAGREIVHCGQPLMAWCAASAKVEPKGNAILITKSASGSAKIDPLMAMFNAATLMAVAPAAHGNINETVARFGGL